MVSATLLGKIFLEDLQNAELWQTEDVDSKITLFSHHSFISFKRFPFPVQSFTIDSSGLQLTFSFSKKNTFSLKLSPNQCTIETPFTGELQLFYYVLNTALYFSDSFHQLVALISKDTTISLNTNGIRDYLASDFRLQKRTIVAGIVLAAENTRLSFTQAGVQTKIKKSLLDQITSFKGMRSKEQITEALTQQVDATLSTILETVPISGIASTLSGGIDSALLSHRVHLHGGTTFASLVLPQSPTSPQTTTLPELRGILPGNHVARELSGPLLATTMSRDTLDPYTDPYGCYFEEIANDLQAKKTAIILTGIGGDDSFYLPSASKNQQVQKSQDDTRAFAQYFMNSFAQDLFQVADKRTSLLPRILSQSQVLYGNIWKKHGIWPVAPFITAETLSLSAHIPADLLQHKKLLRSYVETTMHCPLTARSPRDSFGPSFDQALLSFYEAEGRSLLTTGAIISLGILNTEVFLEQVETEVKMRQFSKPVKMLLYSLLKLELFFRAF